MLREEGELEVSLNASEFVFDPTGGVSGEVLYTAVQFGEPAFEGELAKDSFVGIWDESTGRIVAERTSLSAATALSPDVLVEALRSSVSSQKTFVLEFVEDFVDIAIGDGHLNLVRPANYNVCRGPADCGGGGAQCVELEAALAVTDCPEELTCFCAEKEEELLAETSPAPEHEAQTTTATENSA